jgi:uncharacterized OB-fold protein
MHRLGGQQHGEVGPQLPLMAGGAELQFAAALDDEQLTALLAYLRSRFSDQPQWSNIASEVRDARSGRRPISFYPSPSTEAAPAVSAAMTELLKSPVDLAGTGTASSLRSGVIPGMDPLGDETWKLKAGDKIMVVAFGQGVDILVFEVTAENAKLPKRKGLSGWMARRKEEKNYMKFLAFNEMLPIEKGMRAEFDKKTALSVLWRKRDMIYGLVGGKCKVCGTVQFPRSQVCVNPNCHAIDSQEPYAMAGLEANVMSFTADSLVYSPDPPGYYGMITFPEGGRFMADFTDSDKEQVKVGTKMRMTFRIRDNDTMRGGFKRYFWKAAPV